MSGTILTRLALGALLLLQAIGMTYYCYYPTMWKHHVAAASDCYDGVPTDHAGAIDHLQQALYASDHFAVDGRRAFTLEAMGIVAQHWGHNADARQWDEQSLAIYERTDGPQSEPVQRLRKALADLARPAGR